MAETLILDSEALNALANPRERGALRVRATALLAFAYERGLVVRVPAPVLVELCRDQQRDAALARLLARGAIGVVAADRAICERAGRLLAKHGLASSHAVDALVAATAAMLAPSVIATGDSDDMRRLTASLRDVRVLAL